ncbi:MAG: Maf family protein [Candidatus Dormibacteria bacterium]
MAAAGIPFEVVVSGFDEAAVRHLRPAAQARAASMGKAEMVAGAFPDRVVVGSDTVVAIGGVALGQPRDDKEAGASLRLLSGRTHSVISAVYVCGPEGSRLQAAGVSRVAMKELDEAEIAAYVATGEPFGKAGAYAIQGAASAFARLVRGRLDTVIGIPVPVLIRLLRELHHIGQAARFDTV